jgi:hypothetical protein
MHYALSLIVVFLTVLAAVHFFKTLDADLWHAWRTPVAAGLVAGALLWMLPNIVAIGLVLSAAALYVRLNGRESEAVDGMLLGACSGAAAALPLLFRGGDELLILSECIAAGAVAGYGMTLAAQRIAIDVITAVAAIAAAYAPRAVVAAGVSPRVVAVVIAALVPLLVVAAVFKQWPEVRAELLHEASLGFIADADVRRTAHPLLRHGRGGWTDRHAHREFVRLANQIALRKRRQRDRPDDVARLYQIDIIKLRMQIQEMSRIDLAMRGDEVPSDTMAGS